MKKKCVFLIIFALLAILVSCRKQEEAPTQTPIPPARSTPTPTPTIASENETTNKPVFADITDFESGNNAYTYGFANYPENKETIYQLTAEIKDIPNSSSKGLFMSGNNESESLIMYLTKDIVALTNAQYSVQVDFDIATNIKSPTDDTTSYEAMYVKAGVSSVPFLTIIDDNDIVRSNWNIGSLINSGSDGRTLGTAEKVNSDDDSYQYRHFTQSFNISTNDDGLICVLIAVETSIPNISSIYFDNIIIELSEQ